MSIVTKRRSVRKFDLSRKIPNDILEELCRAGEQAPTARRQDSREYIIINDQSIINEIAKLYKCTMIIEECNTMIAVIGKKNDELPCKEFQVIDLACATENIMVEAVDKGIGSVMIGTYPISERIDNANRVLGLNDGRFVFTFICLGYPLDKDCFKEREKEVVINYNR
jgi:nitroreductase